MFHALLQAVQGAICQLIVQLKLSKCASNVSMEWNYQKIIIAALLSHVMMIVCSILMKLHVADAQKDALNVSMSISVICVRMA